MPGCSHRYRPPAGRALHIVDRQAAQLAQVGIAAVPPPDLSFVRADPGRFALPEDFALLVPGGAPHRPAKRWPAERFAALARALAARGTTPVLLGTAAEEDALTAIAATCPEARDLCGQAGLEDIAALAHHARIAVGNDTGPMHLIAAAGCAVVSLFSGESDPAKVAPRGPSVAVLRRPNLAELTLEEVLAALPPDLPKPAAVAKSSEANEAEREEAPPDE